MSQQRRKSLPPGKQAFAKRAIAEQVYYKMEMYTGMQKAGIINGPVQMIRNGKSSSFAP
jgi:hypothetical protein